VSSNPIIDAINSLNTETPFGYGLELAQQQSVEWLYSRVGHTTCSRFKDAMDFTKAGKPGAKRTAYLWELVIERITAAPSEHYASVAMQHGTQMEPFARMAYEERTGNMVAQTGFIHHPTVPMCGGSPDGLVDDDGGVEIKCPFNSANHLQCFLTGVPEEHLPQIQGLMWITGRQWWDFVSYDSRLPPEYTIYIQRIERNEEYIAKLAKAVQDHLSEVADLSAKLAAAGKKEMPI